MKIFVKRGDTVIMKQGKDRGKRGKVLAVLMSRKGIPRVVVERLNIVKRHQRAKKQEQKGQIIQKERAVDASSVQVVCPKCGKPSRISREGTGKEKKRVCKKCNADF